MEFYDRSDGYYRGARFVDGRLASVIFIDSSVLLPPRDWLISLFQKQPLSASERAGLLRGVSPADVPDNDKTVCACFNVGAKTICEAVTSQGATTPERVGELCQVSTNCGSCRPEISELIQRCG